MTPHALPMDGTQRRALYDAMVLRLGALLDTSQVTDREEAYVTQAVTDEVAVEADGWLSPAEQARDVIEALGGAVELDAADKRAFGELLADTTETVETVRETDEPLQPGF